MSGNNNNEQSWKNKLEELEGLPGEAFNKEAAWGKLYSRPKVSSKNKKSFWYLLAAACIVGVISFPGFFAKEKDIPPIVKTTVPVIKKEFKDTNISNVSPVAKNILALNKPENKNSTEHKKAISPKQDQIITDTTIALVPQPQQVSVVPVQSIPVDTIRSIASAPVKKKLKLMHFNDLNDAPDNNMTGDDIGKPFFPVKFRTKEIYTNNTGNSGNGKDNLIRIKLSSQN